jgi:hypothetical protein
MVLKGSLPCSQEHAIGADPAPADSIAHTHTYVHLASRFSMRVVQVKPNRDDDNKNTAGRRSTGM